MNKAKFLKSIIITVVLILVFGVFSNAEAADRYWVGGTGNWSDAANHWAATSGGAPGAGNAPTVSDDVYFNTNSGGGTATVDGGTTLVANFLMQSGNTTDVLLGSGITLIVVGNFTIDAGTFDGNDASLVVRDNFDSNTGTFTAGTSSVSTYETGSIDATGDTFYDLTVAYSGHTTTLASDITVDNVLTIDASDGTLTDGGGGYDIILTDSGTPFVNNGASVTCNEFNYAGPDATTVTVAGGTYNVTDKLRFGAPSAATTYELAGNINVNGDILLATNAFSGLSILDTQGFGVTADNLTVGGLGSAQGILTANSSAIDINGTVTINNIAGSLINGNTSSWTVSGGWTMLGSLMYVAGTSTVTFDGTVDQNIDALDNHFYDLVSDNSGVGTVVQLSNNPVIVDNDFTVSQGTFYTNGQSLTVTNTVSNDGTFQVQGGETLTLTMDSDSGTVLYIGDGDAAGDTFILKNSGGNDFYDLVINATDGVSDIFQLRADLNVNKDLTLVDGRLDSTYYDYFDYYIAGDFLQTGGRAYTYVSNMFVGGNFTSDGTVDSGQHNNTRLTLTGTSTLTFNNLASPWGNGFYRLTVGQSGNTTYIDDSLAVRNIFYVGTGEVTGLTGNEQISLTGGGNVLSLNANANISVGSLAFRGANKNFPTLNNGYDCDIRLSSDQTDVNQTGNITINGTHDLIIDGDNFANRGVNYYTRDFDLTVGGDVIIGTAANDTRLKTLQGQNSNIIITGNIDVRDVGSGSQQAQFITTGSTVTLDSAVADQSILMSGSHFNNLVLNNTAGAGSDDFIIDGTIYIDGTFTITDGNLDLATNDASVVTTGDVLVDTNGSVTKGNGSWTFDGSTNYVDNSSSGPHNLGNVIVD